MLGWKKTPRAEEAFDLLQLLKTLLDESLAFGTAPIACDQHVFLCGTVLREELGNSIPQFHI